MIAEQAADGSGSGVPSEGAAGSAKPINPVPIKAQKKLTEFTRVESFSEQQLSAFREAAFIDGWRIFYKNNVDSGIQAISPAVANNKIDDVLADQSMPAYSEEELSKLKPLAEYLNLLFPELDISDHPLLTQYQSDRLFNLVFDIQSHRREHSEPAKAFSVVEPVLEKTAKSIRKYFKNRGFCEVTTSFEVADKLQNIVTLTVQAVEQQDDTDCINRPEIIEFSDETLWVNKIRLLGSENIGAVSAPAKEINRILEQQRRDKTAYLTNGVEGFSAAELIDLADAISKLYYSSKGGKLTEAQKKQLTQRVLRLRDGRGMTFEELEEIADSMKAFYRSKGLILANVYVPQQNFQFAHGELDLAIQPGILGSVEVRGIEELHYEKGAITRAFDPYIGHNVSDNITDAYFLVNSLPGLTVQSGLFEAGEKPGETKLVLDVAERVLRFSLSADNYGTRQTGVYRYMFTLDWLNPSGAGDLLSGGYLRTSSPSNSNLGFLNYQLPVFDAKTSFTASFDTNIYESQRPFLGNTVLMFTEGQTYNFATGFNRKIEANKDLNMSVSLLATYKKADTDTLINNQSRIKSTDESFGAAIGWHTDFLVPSIRSVFAFDAAVSFDDNHYGNERRSDGLATIYTAQALSNTLIPVARIIKSKLTSRFSGAWTDKPLPSYDQFALGGPYGVRAFSSSSFLGDTGALFSVEWTIDIMGAMPWRGVVAENTLDIGPYFEEGYSSVYSLVPGDPGDWANFAGVGFLARYEWRREFVIDSSISWPTKSRISTGSTKDLEKDGLGQQFLFSVRYIFD